MRNELDEFRFPHYSLACPDTGPRNVARAAQYAALVTDERRGRRFATWAAHQGYRVSQRLKMITSALP
jgi:hypothetical protein